MIIYPYNENLFGNSSWTYVSLESLPPLELCSFDGTLSVSPPQGRQRLPSKRTRSLDSPDASEKSSRARTDQNSPPPATGKAIDNTTCETNKTQPGVTEVATGPHDAGDVPTVLCPPEPQQNEVNSADESTNIVNTENQQHQGPSDIGTFLPSAALSPSIAKNQNFTFLQKKSSLPKPFVNNLNS